MSLSARACAGFAAAFGGAPAGVAFAPGRVNLIGEHVDYNDGLVLPMPIGAGTAVAWRPDGQVRAIALDFGDATDAFVLGAAPAAPPGDWRSYLRGMTVCMAERGLPVGGAELAICGSIPRGAGLSSSASLCVALGRALAAAAGAREIDQRELALAAQAAEHRFAEVNCGIMDQMAVAVGRTGEAVLLDCRDLSTRTVALPADWAVLIVQSGVSRGLVDGHYNARRRDCEAAAQMLGLASLRDASLANLAALDGTVYRRARHVVSEIARTRAAVAAIESADIAELGRLFAQSHASLRDDFEVSVPPVDELVETLGAIIGERGGARMTGGGFGGAVVAVCEAGRVDAVRTQLAARYRTPQGMPPGVIAEGV